VGFREIWYPNLTERQERLLKARALRLHTPELDPAFTSMFHAPKSGLDLRSLHWAVGDPDAKTGHSKCNVHIDQVTVLADLAGGAGLTPAFPYHYLVALFSDDWNGRFLMGGGGYVGAVANDFSFTVHEGYATVGTDAGHSANSHGGVGTPQRNTPHGLSMARPDQGHAMQGRPHTHAVRRASRRPAATKTHQLEPFPDCRSSSTNMHGCRPARECTCVGLAAARHCSSSQQQQ